VEPEAPSMTGFRSNNVGVNLLHERLGLSQAPLARLFRPKLWGSLRGGCFIGDLVRWCVSG
jgi:hypothetical protein